MPLYRNFEIGDWVLCQVDARSDHRVICRMDFSDRLDGTRFIRHAMPEDFRLYQCRMVDGNGKYNGVQSECHRLQSLKYTPIVRYGQPDPWVPVDYLEFGDKWRIEDTDVVCTGMVICTTKDTPKSWDQNDAMCLNGVAHFPQMLDALQSVAAAHSQKQKTASLKKVKDVLRSLDVIK